MEVKICNLRDSDFNSKFVESLVQTGFAVITHHGVDQGLIKDTQDAWRRFFQQEEKYKNEFVNAQDPNMGYTGLGGEKAVGATRPDLKEFYHWRPGQQLPDEVSFLTQKLYSILEGDVAGRLLFALNGIGSTIDYAKACQNSNNTVMRALYYPPLEMFPPQEAVRSSAHEDINFLTLLVAASAPGLQVLSKDGTWYDVPYEENSIIVNVGDMLQLASKQELKSTTHRVNNPVDPKVDRISIPLFVHPHGDTMLAPGYTAQEYLNERLSAIYQREYTK